MTDETAIRIDSAVNAIAPVILFVLFSLLAAGPLIFAYQGFQWLKTGVWGHVTVFDTFGSMPNTRWVGLQRLLNWLSGAEIGWVLIAVAILVMLAVFYLMERLAERAQIAWSDKFKRQ